MRRAVCGIEVRCFGSCLGVIRCLTLFGQPRAQVVQGSHTVELTGFSRAVEYGVQAWIVIHLQLFVEFEAAPAAKDLAPKVSKTPGQIAALHLQSQETLVIAFPVRLACVLSVDLFRGVENLQCEDRQAIDDEAGSLGVKRRGGVLLFDLAEQCRVDPFDEVVSLLVQAIDGALHRRNGGVTDCAVPGSVFFMPQVEVGPVLCQDQSLELRAGLHGRMIGVVPAGCGDIVEGGNAISVQHRCRRPWQQRCADRAKDEGISRGVCACASAAARMEQWCISLCDGS